MSIKKNKLVRISVYLEQELIDQLDAWSKKLKISRNTLMVNIIKDYLKEYYKVDKPLKKSNIFLQDVLSVFKRGHK